MEKSDASKRGKANKRRGYYYEKKLEAIALEHALGAQRMPGSGAYKGFPEDVHVAGLRHSVKSRKAGFAFDDELEREGVFALVTFDSGKRGSDGIVRLKLGVYLRLLRSFLLYKGNPNEV